MSGHITITSRGSSVGSSASSCRIAARRTSTWRARPWQEWICDAAVDRLGPRRLVVADAGLQALQQRVAGSRRSGGGGRVKSSRTSWSSRLSWPQEASSRLAGQRRGLVRSAAGGLRGSSASFSHSAGDGCSAKRWTSRPAASARRTSTWPRGSRVRPNRLRRGGRSASAGSSRRRAHACCEPLGGVGLGDRARAAGGTARPARRRRPGCRRRRPPSRRGPSPAGAGRSGRTGRRCGGRSRSGARGCRRGARPGSAATARRATRRRPRAAARPSARAATGPPRCPRPPRPPR